MKTNQPVKQKSFMPTIKKSWFSKKAHKFKVVSLQNRVSELLNVLSENM